MFRKHYNVTIHLPGGIVAAGDLYAIVEAAERARVTHIQLGARQQLFCKVPDKYGPSFLDELLKAGISFEVNEAQFPNIVSSYVTENIFVMGTTGATVSGTAGTWLSEGVYKDILDAFDFKPRCKINLVECHQSFVPFFTGNINFISSGIGNYWHLYLRFPRTSLLYPWKTLVYSQDIPRLSRLIEEVLWQNQPNYFNNPSANGDGLYEAIHAKGVFAMQAVREPLQLPRFDLPYYEGFNRYGNKTWLGIYRRDECFPLSFLRDICLICFQTRIGQLYTTPWKSLLIKGIGEGDRRLWEYVLGKYRINVRHAAHELNWQVEDGNEDGLRLKRYLVRQFDLEDTRTDGLCFVIKMRPGTGLSGSIIIRKQEGVKLDRRKELDRYDILHTPDLDAHSKEYILYREGLEKENLFVYLVSLCKEFYEKRSKEDPLSLARRPAGADPAGRPEQIPEREKEWVHQCRHCLTLFDQQYGDPENGIAPGNPFSALDPAYACPVCGGDKSDFRAIEKSTLIHG